ncbi:MAG TPA: hypothetical protein VK469_24660 [Candidatus Kapabacteria bacterium]|nr:hypothetical protein [Candidatus Kapabacteria bacterium]
MNLRKRLYFKPLCLLVAALFTGQCISFERKLISTEEKIIENGNQDFIYELEKIKTPSIQSPTVEYRILKFPTIKVESVNTYELIKIDRALPIIGGVIAGAAVGILIGNSQIQDPCQEFGKPVIGFLLGASMGGLIINMAHLGIKQKSVIKNEIIKEPTGSYLTKKHDSTPIPARNLPLEFKWWARKLNVFKTQTDDQGIVRINLIDDLKITKLPPEHHLYLCIHYLNPKTQLDELFEDSLGPENKKSKK